MKMFTEQTTICFIFFFKIHTGHADTLRARQSTRANTKHARSGDSARGGGCSCRSVCRSWVFAAVTHSCECCRVISLHVRHTSMTFIFMSSLLAKKRTASRCCPSHFSLLQKNASRCNVGSFILSVENDAAAVSAPFAMNRCNATQKPVEAVTAKWERAQSQ